MAFDARDIVGESAVWDDRSGTLYWVDIITGRIHALQPSTGRKRTWQAPSIATSIGLRDDGGAIVGLDKRIALWDDGGSFGTFVEIEPERGGNRLNEGVVGPDHAFWVGTMQNNINEDGSARDIEQATGQLLRVDGRGGVTRLTEDRFGITNTMVWTDAGRFVTADTVENTLYVYAINAQSGLLADRRAILSGYERGLPDGSCIDEEGYIWNCRVCGGHCLVRIVAGGQIDRVIELPCAWPTSCAFGGDGLDRLYVTSARFTMDQDHLASNPQEGGLFEVDVGMRGRPANRFA